MNSHNPFNTGGSGCTNDFRSADQLVDRIIGDAYHVVKEVYLALGNLTYIYNYLQKYGLIITVDSEDAIKDIPLSIGKFARVYNKSDTAGYYFTDYLYVEDDRTGIIPNDITATGSWISTKSTGSNASFVRIWKYRAVADGETTIQLPTDMPIVSVQTIYVQGIRQDVGEGFIYNEGNATLTLADELEAGNLVTVIIGISDPDMDIDIFEVLKNTDGASNIGTLTGSTVEERLTASDTILADLQGEYGYANIGQTTVQKLRNYAGPGKVIECLGYAAVGDFGHGIFDRIEGNDTIPDDDCVHIRDSLGRLWRRRISSDGVIRMAWAGGKTLYQTDQPQDDVFRNCLKAAASLSSTGYPTSIIAGISFGPMYFAERHHIRCGNFPESTAWKLPDSGGGYRFGLDMIAAIGEGSGFFIVQANNPYFHLTVDNSGLEFNTNNYTDEQIAVIAANNYVLRLESMVNAPEFNVQVGNFPGRGLYSTGKKDYSAVTAQWPDLVQVLPSIQNVGKAAFNFKTCGQDFYLTNTGAGLGHFHSVWTQNNRLPGYISNCYDLTMTFENYIPHNEKSGGLIFSECGTMSLENILVGAGGIGNLFLWDCRNVHMNRHIAICGNTTWAASNQIDDLYAVEICNSEVHISGGHAQNSGRFLRVGFNSRVTFSHFTAWYVSKFILATNNLNKLKYRGQRSQVTGDAVKVFLKSGFLQQLNTSNQGWACEPVIEFDETIGAGWQLELNTENNDIHSGYDSQDEAKLAIFEAKTTAYGSLFIGDECKLEGNTTNYVIRLANKQQLASVRTRATSFCRIRYTEDGSQSSFGLKEASHPLQGTVVGRNETYSYPYRRPGRYFVSLTIPSAGGSCSVNKNGMPIFQTNVPGIHGIVVDLGYQEQVNITVTGGEAVLLGSAQWRYILES